MLRGAGELEQRDRSRGMALGEIIRLDKIYPDLCSRGMALGEIIRLDKIYPDPCPHGMVRLDAGRDLVWDGIRDR